MARSIVATDKAPAAIGPYSQGIIASGKMLFTAGQIALDPDTGEMAPADIGLQTRQVLKNLSAVLVGGESSLQQVVKVTIYLLDMSDYDLVNEIYTEYFGESNPARALVQVSRLPKDALIEMDCVALAGQ